MNMTEETLNKGTSMKIAKTTLSIDRKQLYALKDEHSRITNNRYEVIKVSEEFYIQLYNSNDNQTKDPSIETMKI